MSRFPLGNVELIRHRRTKNWHGVPQRLPGIGQPRFGGRVALSADVRVGDQFVRVYASHLESGRLGVGPTSREAFRRSQVMELIEHSAGLEQPVLIGGDLNIRHYLSVLRGERRSEPTTAALIEAGFADAHGGVPLSRRVTSDSGLVIDALFGRGLSVVDAGVGAGDRWRDCSDHRPIWAQVGLPSTAESSRAAP